MCKKIAGGILVLLGGIRFSYWMVSAKSQSDPTIAVSRSLGVIAFCLLFIAAGIWLIRKE